MRSMVSADGASPGGGLAADKIVQKGRRFCRRKGEGPAQWQQFQDIDKLVKFLLTFPQRDAQVTYA